jgi:hypothetical protein
MKEHAPSLPATLQASQLAPHGPSQHHPSAQKPETQSVPAVHITTR